MVRARLLGANLGGPAHARSPRVGLGLRLARQGWGTLLVGWGRVHSLLSCYISAARLMPSRLRQATLTATLPLHPPSKLWGQYGLSRADPVQFPLRRSRHDRQRTGDG